MSVKGDKKGEEGGVTSDLRRGAISRKGREEQTVALRAGKRGSR